MALAFAAEPLPTDGSSHSDHPQSANQTDVERRIVNRLIADFPEKADLSTPESALAAWTRAWARGDYDAVAELGFAKMEPLQVLKMKRYRERHPEELAAMNNAMLGATVLEVLTYRQDLATVISKLKFPTGAFLPAP